MRICILSRGDLFPTNHGAAVKIVRTAEAFSRAGAPTCIVTDDRDGYARYVDGRREAIAFTPRFRAAEEWPPLPRLGRIAESLCRRLGYPEEELFLYRPMFDPAWWARALQVGLVEDIDVFQAEFPGYGVPAFLAARALSAIRGRRVRSSVVQHNVEWDRLAAFGVGVGRIRAIEQAVLGRVDEVIAVSADDRRRMVAAGLDPGRITVIPHGVELGPFQAAAAGPARAIIGRRYGIPRDAPLLFFHGTLHYRPNTDAVRFLVEALLPELLPSFPRLRLLVVGQGAPTWLSHPAVTWAGPVEDLALHVAAADLCVCPIEAGGGTRMKLLEYLAAGRAVVSTTKGAEGIRVNDEMVLADGLEPFAEACAALLRDPVARARLGARGAAFAARFGWDAVARATLALYAGEGRGLDWNDRLLGGPPATPVRPLDAHLPPGRMPSKPRTLLLLLNRGCNLRCRFCDLWDAPASMPIERLLPVLDDAVAIGTEILVITGGEPFLHPDLFRAVREARARGLSVNITTNGTYVEKRWKELVDSGVDSLSLSIDGMEATHDRLRGQPGAWKRTMDALDRLVAHGRIGLSVYFTANRDNVSELVAVWSLARSRGVGFEFWPVNDAPELALRTEAEQAAWRAAVAELAAKEARFSERAAFDAAALAYHAGAGGNKRCLGFIDQYGVTWDGRLLPCCVWGGEGLTVGNVYERPLRELWASAEVQSYRERLFHEGCAAGCFNHSLYEFERSTGLPFVVGAAAALR